MRLTKILLSTVGGAALALTLSACSSTASNNTTTNTAAANKSNTAVVVNSNQAAVNSTTAVNVASNSNANVSANKAPNTATPTSKATGETIRGELQIGKSESVVLYFGEESGDYAAYCFGNDSEAGRAILAACKDREQCEVTGTIGEGACKVPGLEADLSASGRIVKANSVKSLGRKK